MVIEKEYLGNTLNHDELITAIGKALKSGHEKVNLTDEKKKIPRCIRKAKYLFHRPFASAKVDACNPVILRWITWTIQKDIKKKPSVQNRFINGAIIKTEKLLLIIRQLKNGLKNLL